MLGLIGSPLTRIVRLFKISWQDQGMIWFACIHDGDLEYNEMYINALKSAIKQTTLAPYLIYDGSNTAFVATVTKLGATVIKHTFSLANTNYFKRQNPGWQRIARGTYLRLDIPMICQNIDFYDTYALYTDVDILFLTNPVPTLEKYKPAFLAGCPETDPTNWSYINAGVLLLNIDSMYETYIPFMKCVNDTLDIPGYDQTVLNKFYIDKIDRLPVIFNYKPYWGINPETSIIHYHGPKPSEIKAYLASGKSNPHYMHLFSMVSKDTWSKFLGYYTFYQTK